MKHSKGIDLPFDGSNEEWVLYLLGLPQSKWAWRVTWGLTQWYAWTYCQGLAGLLVRGVWGYAGYYLSLALRQFEGS